MGRLGAGSCFFLFVKEVKIVVVVVVVPRLGRLRLSSVFLIVTSLGVGSKSQAAKVSIFTWLFGHHWELGSWGKIEAKNNSQARWCFF